MSVSTAYNTQAPQRVLNFAEETCFNRDDQLRQVRAPVMFRLYSIGKRLGAKVDVEISSDYGVYYDRDNEYLLTVLAQAVPAVNWRQFVFWCRPDQTRITVIDPEDDKPVAHLETRKYHGKQVCAAKVDAGMYGANVMSFNAVVARAKAKALEEGFGDPEVSGDE